MNADELKRWENPVTIVLADGKPRGLRYSNASYKRIKKAFGKETLREVLALEFLETASTLIYEGLVEKDVQPDVIDELIPTWSIADIQATVMSAITGRSEEELKNVARTMTEENQSSSTTNDTSQPLLSNGHSA